MVKIVGIYAYRDKQTDKIVYIGKDSNISKNIRHKHHILPYYYSTQQINRVLQNNPDRYEYEVLKKFDAEEYNKNLLNALEIIYIKRHKPLFNFTIGGEGATGRKVSKKTKKKISNSLKGENSYWYGKTFSEEHKRKISESHKGKFISDETKLKMSENNAKYWKGKYRSDETKKKISEANKGKISPMKGKTHSEESKRKMSESRKIKYAKIMKYGFNHGKQNYGIYMNGKFIKRSIYPSKLLEWFSKEFPKEILILNIYRGD